MGNSSCKDNYKLYECSICGKKFIPAPEHIYKVRDQRHGNTMWCCSYTCYNKAKEKYKSKKKK